MGVGRAICITAAIMAVAAAGCGGSSELRTGAQAGGFIDDLVRGTSDDWDLATEAGAAARSAWLHRAALERIGEKLRADGGEWACSTAEAVNYAPKVVNGLGLGISPEQRIEIILQVGEDDRTRDEANALIDEILSITPFEATEALSAVCGL
jgi:hypothetical protein